MVYSLEEISKRVAPIAKRHGIPQVYVFGSYARGEATDKSDVDFLVDLRGSDILGLWELSGLYLDLEESMQKGIDVVQLETLDQPERVDLDADFVDAVRREMVQVYGEQRQVAH